MGEREGGEAPSQGTRAKRGVHPGLPVQYRCQLFGVTCDNWNFNSSNPCLYVGGNYNQNTNHGLFYVNYNSVSNSNTNIGCRTLLCVLLTNLRTTAQVVAHLSVKISSSGSGLVHLERGVGKLVQLKGGYQSL